MLQVVLSFLLSLEICDFGRERRREVYRGNIWACGWCQSGELCLLDHSPDPSQHCGALAERVCTNQIQEEHAAGGLPV